MWRKIKTFVGNININETLYGMYMFAVWAIYLFVGYYKGKDTIVGFLWLLLLCAFMIFIVSKWMMSLISKIPAARNTTLTNKRKILSFCVFFIISFGILCLWYIACYPGAYSVDCLDQYNQALTGYYNDWHPVWHTLVFFKLPLMLTGQSASIVFFQILYFGLILAYLGLKIYQFAGRKAAVIALAYILLNPFTGCIAIYPYKDVGMAVTALWAMLCVAELYYTNGQWALKKGRVTLLAVLLANTTLFRHNAILFTLPLALALFFYLERRKWLKLMLIFFVFIFMVRVPLYKELNAGEAAYRRRETMGLPLTVIGNVVKEHPELLDDETAYFVYRMASQEQWEEDYVCGEFNSIKWAGIDLSVIEETSTMDILRMTARCFSVATESSCKAFFMLTDMVYSIEGTIEGDYTPNVVREDRGIEGIQYRGNEKILEWLMWYGQIMSRTVFKYIRYIGISILIMLGVMLNRSNLKSWEDWKKLLLCLPIFAYDFGTMLLLTGADARFFYVSFLVCPVVVLIMLREEDFKHEIA